MSTSKFRELLGLPGQRSSTVSRRMLFKHATVLGATAVAGAVLSPTASALGDQDGDEDDEMPHSNNLRPGDRSILIAAEIAEALAVTTYSNIIDLSPFFTRIPVDDQGYIKAALQEEMSHYALEQSVTNENSPFDEFFYPKQMFVDTQTTLNTLVTLEDAFIAAYLVGVRDFSSRALRVTAARIMGIESDHRTLARVIGPDVAAMDGGPIMSVTGAQGVQEITTGMSGLSAGRRSVKR